MHTITKDTIAAYIWSLKEKERARATVTKYEHILDSMYLYFGGAPITKADLLVYREALQRSLSSRTVNVYIAAINSYLEFWGLPDIKLCHLRVQRKPFVDDEKELTEKEYKKLLATAQRAGKSRLYYLMLTLCGTGIRIGELKYITVDAIRTGVAEIRNKGKSRTILIQSDLRKKLREYVREEGIKTGMVFVTRTGKPLDRSYVAHELKALCDLCGVDRRKVFPHNFRHLFARAFYAIEKNLAHLADILGHSSIETTRIYVAVTARACERTMRRMQLIV